MEIRAAHTFVLTFTFVALLQTLQQPAQVQPEADFALVKLCHVTSDNVNNQAVVNGGGLLVIRDAGTGRQLMDNPVPLDSISGRAQYPFIMSSEYRFRRQNTIICELTNSGTNVQVVRITLHGYKIYNGS